MSDPSAAKQRRLTSFFSSKSKESVPQPQHECEMPSSSSEKVSSEKKTSKKAVKREFCDEWLSKNPWLKYEYGKMTCTTCIAEGKDNPFTHGCTNFRHSTLTRHISSVQHKSALEAQSLRCTMQKQTVSLIMAKNDAAIGGLRSVYWLGKEQLPTSKHKSLLNLQKLQGCTFPDELQVGASSYTSHTSAEEMQDAIVSVLLETTNEKLTSSPFIAILLDESCDISVTKKLLLYARTVSPGFDPETLFISNMHIKNGTAKTIHAAVKETLSLRGISLDKVIVVGSDGASVMTGSKNGFVALVRRDDSPFVLGVHCIAHRLALCSSQAAEKIPYLKAYQQILSDIFYHFKRSALLREKVKEIQDILHDPKLMYKELHSVRNACRLCSRSYSSEKTITDEPKDVQNTEGSRVVMGRRNVDRKPTHIRGEQPFWEQTPVPMWKSAYDKLKIQPSNVPVPTVNHRGVDLPRKVKRDHLTILTALAETTQLDNPNVNYNYNDDPRLQFPIFKEDCKRINLEGRKTAHEMMKLYQDAFLDFKAAPDIPNFNPVTSGYMDTTLSVNALQERIEKRRVCHAIEIYDRLEDKGEGLPLEVEEKLLELVCVYNGEDPQEKLPALPTNYFKKEDEPFDVWKGNKADQIFQKHVAACTVTPYMYNVYVSGLLKYSEKEAPKKALSLYQEMKEKKIPVYLCTYNLLLAKKDLKVKDVFGNMKKEGVVPNKQTYSLLYNRLVESSLLKDCIAEKHKSGFDLDFEDMRAVYYLGKMHMPFLETLIDYMASKKTWYLDHPGENVLLLIMKDCRELRSPAAFPIAMKLYKLRNDMGIRYKVSDYCAEKSFYSNFFDLTVRHAPFDYFTKVYKELVPFYITRFNVPRILEKMTQERVPGDFLINLYEDVFNFLPIKAAFMVDMFKNLELIFTEMSADRHSPELKKEYAERAHFFFTEFVQFEMPRQLQRREEKMCNMLVSSNTTLLSLSLMLKDPSFLDKAWDCYMDYTTTTNKFLRKQTIRWEPIMWRVIEVEDRMKIKQFINKIKISSTWVDCSFLPQMREPLERILEADDRATLDFVLSNLSKK